MIKRKWLNLVVGAVMLAGLSGCATAPDEPEAAVAVAGIREVATEADPEGAVAAVYAVLEEEPEATVLDDEGLLEIVGIDPSKVMEYCAYYTSPSSGLADIIILKPYDITRDEVREALYLYKEKRVQEFENYDILGAYSIAQNALVYDQGDYVILMMQQDNDEARAIVDGYIPLEATK